MIIQALLDVIYAVFWTLTLPISIPAMPDGVKSFIAISLDYIGTGLAILGNFFDVAYLLSLFGLVVAVDVGIMVYKLVMWVIAKIPMLGVK